MANNALLGGFRWHKNLMNPSAAEPPYERGLVASGYATTIPIGYPVKKLSTGYMEVASPGDSVFGVMAGVIQRYDGSNIVAGGKYTTSTYGTVFERQTVIRFIPARLQEFRCVADDATTATTYAAYLAFEGENVEWSAGTAVNDYAGCLLDISGHNTTNTLSVNLKRLHNKEFTDFTGLYVPWVVEFNLIQSTTFGSTTGT